MTEGIQDFTGMRPLTVDELDFVAGGDGPQISCTIDGGTMTCSCPPGSSMTITTGDDGGVSFSCEAATS